VSASASDLHHAIHCSVFGLFHWGVFRDRGQHALIIYDDLSKHAVAYREISLCCAVRRDARRTLAMYSICIPVY